MKYLRHAALVGAIVTGGAVTLAILLLSKRIGPEPRLPTSHYLPETVRAFLDKRMEHHASDMSALVRAVVLLDFKTAAEGAERVASDASLARPLTNDASELNSLLPPRFFELQDQLRTSAGQLARAARSEDIDAMATAYGQMTRACVSCHGVYLKGPANGHASVR